MLATAALLTIGRADRERGGEASEGRARAAGLAGRSLAGGIIDSRDSPVRAGDPKPDSVQKSGSEPDPDTVPSHLLLLLASVGTAIMVMVLRMWYVRRSADRDPREAGGEFDSALDALEVRSAVVGTIEAMLADPDPNTAIIGAYARLLERLAACGMQRRIHEAPVEHLQRVLASLDVRPEPLRRLIDLFEIARFSTHALTPSHRTQALHALRSVASDLAVVTPDDVRAVAVPTLAHRVVLRAEVWARHVSPDEVVRGILDTVPAPSWR